MTGIAFASGVRTSFAMAALIIGVATTLPAAAQQPSKAATDAVRSNCRSDYMAKCMSVKPGGIEAIQCLKKNEASLSAACQSAVAAIKLPGEAAAPAQPASPPAATAAPAPAAPSPAASAPKPAPAVATPSKPAAPKPVQAKPAAAPKPVVATAPRAPAPVAAPPPPAASTAPHPLTLQEAQIVRLYCTVDYQVLCPRVPVGGGRVLQCLANNQPALSPNCKQAIAKVQ
jgi:hypothetical protein